MAPLLIAFLSIITAIPAAMANDQSCYVVAPQQVIYQCGGPESAILVPGADVQTFRILLAGAAHYAIDKNHAYWGDKVIPGADPATFSVMNPVFTRDKNHIYADGKPLPGVDLATATFVDKDAGVFLKDKSQVYYGSRVVAGADSATFRVINGFGADKTSVYDFPWGYAIPGSHGPSAHKPFSLNPFDLFDGTIIADRNHTYTKSFGSGRLTIDGKTTYSCSFNQEVNGYVLSDETTGNQKINGQFIFCY